MARSKSTDKGKALEDAVEQIEAAIFAHTPAFEKATFTIERNKFIKIDGVQHEIDLYVTIDLGYGYKPVYIFECKNREEIADKNDIIVLSEKINVPQAQKGYFIAKKVSRYAKAQAKKDKRIELLLVDTDVNAIADLPNVSFGQSTCADVDVSMTMQKDSPEDAEMQEIDFGTASIELDGERINGLEFLRRLQELVMEERTQREKITPLPDGIHHYHHSKEFDYSGQRLTINGVRCLSVIISLDFDTTIIQPKIVSKFDVERRGRIVTLDKVTLPQGASFNLQLTILKSQAH